ncbi:MAG: peptide transporter [Planctomycetes bacterium]|nr:peptide transporter [Planctomycetota bacterium]
MLTDKELNQYRDLVKPASTFEEGFGWKAVFGAIFVGLIMLPAAMYMSMAIGEESIGPAAKWVTVILFLEMAKRARTALKPAEIFILFAMAGTLVSSPTQNFFWRQYLVQSDAARSFGLGEAFPAWYAPSDSAVLDHRSFLMTEWALPLGLMLLTQIVGRIDGLILGYGLFRVTSDIEKLPFPMAPIGAAGVTALSENQSGQEGWRWRVFCIGTAFGMVFMFLYGGIPVLTGTFLKEPFTLLPLPWLDTTVQTQNILPAVPTGLIFDMGHFFIGMALPFFGVLGAFIGLVVMMMVNPFVLLPMGMLPSWKPGMNTVQTVFSNHIDFYLSFGMGLGLAVGVIGIWQCVSSLRRSNRPAIDAAAETAKPVAIKGSRGDIRTWVIIAVYLGSSALYIALCGWLLDWDFRGSQLIWVLLFFAFVYTPFVSYVTARLEGLAGQVLAIPYVRETAFILSGFKGIEVWLLPIPLANYGEDTMQYRIAELVGCSFRSIWKLTIFVVPVLFILSIVYGQLIWSLGPIPSAAYPFASQMWDLLARNECLILSSTQTGFSPFLAALKPAVIAAGGVTGMLSYAALSAFGLPVLLIYGVVKGLGGSIPQALIVQFAGALFGRFVMAKRFGPDRWRQFAPVLLAGYGCGAGLIMMFAVGIKFLSASIFQLPY